MRRRMPLSSLSYRWVRRIEMLRVPMWPFLWDRELTNALDGAFKAGKYGPGQLFEGFVPIKEHSCDASGA